MCWKKRQKIWNRDYRCYKIECVNNSWKKVLPNLAAPSGRVLEPRKEAFEVMEKSFKKSIKREVKRMVVVTQFSELLEQRPLPVG